MGLPSQAVDSEHFLASRSEVAQVFEGRTTRLSETFYRHMRRRHDVLMEDGKPAGGRWNYNAENRGRLTGPAAKQVPEPLGFHHDVTGLERMVRRACVATIGSVDLKDFPWPRDRGEALRLLNHFLEHGLGNFGRFQDAMSSRHPVLFHSRLSFALNTKMLSPAEVIRLTLDFWRANRRRVDLSQVEGFVRQILGWREYLRGIYWERMPAYAACNHFGHRRLLEGNPRLGFVYKNLDRMAEAQRQEILRQAESNLARIEEL